jgi:hypothetical protein
MIQGLIVNHLLIDIGEVNWDGCSLEKELEEFEDSFEQDEIVYV